MHTAKHVLFIGQQPETADFTDASAAADVAAYLARTQYDAVVIGGGLRIPAPSLLLFEQLVNAVHRGAPQAAIAFNTSPQDTAAAAARWLEARA